MVSRPFRPLLSNFSNRGLLLRPRVEGAELVFDAEWSVTLNERVAKLGGHRVERTCRIPITRILDFEDQFGYAGIEKDDAYNAARFAVYFGVDPDRQSERATLLHQDARTLDVPGLKVPLFPFQARAVQFLRHAESAMLGDEPGLGKTLQALAWSNLSGGRTLVLCPAGVVGVWEGEIASKTDRTSATVRGMTAQAIPATDFVIVPYSVVHGHVAALAKVGFGNLVIDEAHAIKDHKALRTKAARNLADAVPRRLLLSGSFFLRSNEDLYVPMHMVHPGTPGIVAFRERYCKVEKRRFGRGRQPVQRVVGSQRSDELRTRLEPWMASRRLSEVVQDLPPLREQVINVELTGEDLDRYRACIQRMRSAAANGVTSMAAFREAAVALERAKTKAAEELLEEIDPLEDRKALVFSQHLAPLSDLQSLKRWQDRHIRLDGSVPQEKRTELIRAFQTNPRLRVAFLQLQAAGVGITLDAADTVLLVDPGWVPALIDQAIRRARRINTRHPVMAYHFVVKDTLDEMRWQRIQERRANLDTIHGAEADLEAEVYGALLRD